MVSKWGALITAVMGGGGATPLSSAYVHVGVGVVGGGSSGDILTCILPTNSDLPLFGLPTH